MASLAYSLWITAHDPSWAYFVTSARAWEFGAGALLAFVPVSGRVRPSAASWAGRGCCALALSAFVLDEHTPMPGTAAIVIVVAAAVVIWVGDPQLRWAHSRLLTLRPATWLGDISYSVYLWHWPLIILLPSLLGHGLRPIDRVSILLATLGLAALTKTWVEDPVRRARRFGLRAATHHLPVRRDGGRPAGGAVRGAAPERGPVATSSRSPSRSGSPRRSHTASAPSRWTHGPGTARTPSSST